ncbi:unnamed protein product [Ixodes persulcatus]
MANRSRQDVKDDDLRRRLRDLGEVVGPVTDTTRVVMQRRLSSLLQNGMKTPSPRRSLPNRASLGRMSSDDSDGEAASVNQRSTRRRSAAIPSSRSRRTSPPERPRRPEPPPTPPPPVVLPPVVDHRPNLRTRVGYAYSDEFSDTDNDVPKTPSRSPYPLQQQQRYNHSLLVHRADDTGRSNGFVASTDQRPRYQWVSFVLLLAAALFFVFLGAAYMGVRYPSQPGSKPKSRPRTDSPYNATLCENLRLKPCIWEANVPAALELAGRIQRLLGNLAGKYECGEATQPSLSYDECFEEMRRAKDDSLAEEAFEDSLLLLFENPAWGIVLLGRDDEPMSVFYQKGSVLALRALRPVKSYWCFIRLTLQSVAMQMVFGTFAVVGVCALYYLLCWWKARRDERRRRLYTLVEKITGACSLLTSRLFQCTTLGRSLVQQPRTRLTETRLRGDTTWECRLLNRSLTRRDIRRWSSGNAQPPGDVQAATSVLEGRRVVDIGHFFQSVQESCEHAPFSCTLADMVFVSEQKCALPLMLRRVLTESGGGGGSCTDYIAQVISRADILLASSLLTPHILPRTGNLITVKYLRLERYHERFPESQYCREPLKPSNSLRLSLDASNSPEEDAL